MKLIRGAKMLLHENKYYIIGSGSNKFFRYLTYAMGPFSMMIWLEHDTDKYDPNRLETFDTSLPITLIPHEKASFFKRVKLISDEVKRGDCFSFKLPLPDSIIGCLFAWMFGKPFVIESGGDFFKSLWYHGGLSYKMAALPLDVIVKLEHRIAKHIIYVSKNFMQSIYPSNARQIGCSDAIIGISANEVLENRLKHIDNHKGSFRLGLIGATNAGYRGHDTLIQAAAKLTKLGYDVKVSFLGGGTADEKRRAMARRCGIEDRIEICGRVPNQKVVEWVDDIDVLVMPTLVESLGRAVIEAMSRACPIIGTYETALNEQLGSDCLVHARNVDEIVRAVERIIKHKDYAKLCAYENFYRSMKYNGDLSYSFRKEFYDQFYELEHIKR